MGRKVMRKYALERQVAIDYRIMDEVMVARLYYFGTFDVRNGQAFVVDVLGIVGKELEVEQSLCTIDTCLLVAVDTTAIGGFE